MALPIFPQLPNYGIGSGVTTPIGTFLPPGGGRVFYVRSATTSGDPDAITKVLCPTIAAAGSYCRAGAGDIIAVLPGHTEQVGASTNLTGVPAGVRIIGVGNPRCDDAPTLNWNATTSLLAMSTKNISIENMRLTIDGINAVVNGINISAAGCSLIGNYIRVAQTAKAAVTAITVAAAADCMIFGNYIQGIQTAALTDVISVTSASATRLSIMENIINAAAGVTGVIRVGAVAALQTVIASNKLENTVASSTSCIAYGAAASDGLCYNNYLGCNSTGAQTTAVTGILIGAGCLVGFFNNQCVNDPLKSGLLQPAVDS